MKSAFRLRELCVQAWLCEDEGEREAVTDRREERKRETLTEVA